MDLIKYSSELLSLNLSAYKFSIFSLLISIQDKNKVNKEEKLFYAEILYHFINSNTDISSKSLLISKIKNQISSNIAEINKNLVKKEKILSDNLIYFLNENLTNIKTINDLFSFFKQNLSILKEINLPENYNINGEEEIEKNIQVSSLDGVGIADIYIKKCLLSFKRLSFPKLIILYEDIIKFANDNILNNYSENLTIKEKEYYFSEIFNKSSNSFFNSQILFGFDKNEENEENNENIFEINKTSNNNNDDNYKLNHRIFNT